MKNTKLRTPSVKNIKNPTIHYNIVSSLISSSHLENLKIYTIKVINAPLVFAPIKPAIEQITCPIPEIVPNKFNVGVIVTTVTIIPNS